MVRFDTSSPRGSTGPINAALRFRFDATAGTYMQRPAPTDIIWRISNYNSVAAKWQVSELHFFEDIVCADELEGGVLSSIGVRPDAEKYGSIHAFKPTNVQDNDISTVWVADCEPPAGTWTGCVEN